MFVIFYSILTCMLYYYITSFHNKLALTKRKSFFIQRYGVCRARACVHIYNIITIVLSVFTRNLLSRFWRRHVESRECVYNKPTSELTIRSGKTLAAAPLLWVYTFVYDDLPKSRRAGKFFVYSYRYIRMYV